jgi:hypothetical protein
VINKKFPDMAGLVQYGHGKGLKMGWYENGCACGERVALPQNYGAVASRAMGGVAISCALLCRWVRSVSTRRKSGSARLTLPPMASGGRQTAP